MNYKKLGFMAALLIAAIGIVSADLWNWQYHYEGIVSTHSETSGNTGANPFGYTYYDEWSFAPQECPNVVLGMGINTKTWWEGNSYSVGVWVRNPTGTPCTNPYVNARLWFYKDGVLYDDYHIYSDYASQFPSTINAYTSYLQWYNIAVPDYIQLRSSLTGNDGWENIDYDAGWHTFFLVHNNGWEKRIDSPSLVMRS